MKKLIYIACGLLAGMAQSCDFLDKEPEDIIETGKFFENAQANALEQYCNDFYPKLFYGHGAHNGYNSMLEKEWDSDNILPWKKNDVSFGHHIVPNEAADTEWKWENVRACNIFLNNYTKSPAAQADKERYAGEILFFKSLDYFNKVVAYGDVPWYESELTPEDTDELYKGRDSRIVVMKNVLNDIDQAIKWLPKKTEVYRVSKDAALALKARMCLFEGTYRRYHGIEGDVEFLQAAYDAAGELMKPEYGYSLYTGSAPNKAYYELFIQADYNTNPEVILSKEYNPAINKGNNVSRQLRKGEPDQLMGMSRDCANDYLKADGTPFNPSGVTKVKDELENRDPRLLQTIATPYAGPYTYYLEGKRSDISTLLGGATHSSTGYAIAKFYSDADYTETHGQGTTDAILFRYAEVLLVRAEAAAELGKDPELNKTVNALRKRVGFTVELTENPASDPLLVAKHPNVNGAKADLIREIRRERRVELFGEGLRRSDLLRWKCGKRLAEKRGGMPLYTDVYSAADIEKLKKNAGVLSDGSLDVYGNRSIADPVFEEPKHYLFSLPRNEMDLNPNLKPNNPGWGD